MSRARQQSRRTTAKGTRPATRPPTKRRSARPGPVRPDPVSTSRTTPRDRDHTVRPRWHKPAGWAGIAVGVLIALLNDAMLVAEGAVLLPFGHSELYLLLGVLVAGWSTRFLGLFDRHTIYV